MITSCHPLSLAPSNNVVFIVHAVVSVYVVSRAGIHIFLSLGLFSVFHFASGDTQQSIFSCRTFSPDIFFISFLILLSSQLAILAPYLRSLEGSLSIFGPDSCAVAFLDLLACSFSRILGLRLCFRLTSFVVGLGPVFWLALSLSVQRPRLGSRPTFRFLLVFGRSPSFVAHGFCLPRSTMLGICFSWLLVSGLIFLSILWLAWRVSRSSGLDLWLVMQSASVILISLGLRWLISSGLGSDDGLFPPATGLKLPSSLFLERWWCLLDVYWMFP